MAIKPDDVIPPDPNPKNPTHRNRAYTLRKKSRRGEMLSEDESEWLGKYDAAQGTADANRYKNASKSVHIEEHMTDAAGDAAAAAAMPKTSREEGRRLDYILDLMLRGQQQLLQGYERMNAQLLQRNQQMEEVHLSMLDAVREHYIARIDAEAELALNKEPEDDKPDLLEDMAKGFAQQLAASKGKPPA